MRNIDSHIKVFPYVITAIYLIPFLLPGGCATSQKDKGGQGDISKGFKVEYRVAQELKESPPKTVCVLPFENSTGKDEAFEIVRKTFYNHLSSRQYGDRELYRIDATLRAKGLFAPGQFKQTTPQELGELLKADALIYGEITDFKRLFLGLYSQVAVGLKVKMVRAKDGTVLWEASHTSRTHGGGVAIDPISLIPAAISASLNMRDIQLLRASDDLCRDLVATLPGPPLSEALRPPVIKTLVQDSAGQTRKAGDTIKVVLIGAPDHHAWFDISDYKKGIEMIEEPAGTYTGEYRVLPGDNLEKAIIKGYLTDTQGNSSQWIDALGTVGLDTAPPKIPTGFKAIGRDKFINLSWVRNREKDLAGYRIYRSNTPLTGYKPLSISELNYYKDAGLENFKSYYYKISAIDLVANESPPSDYIEGVAVKPGPTSVSGEIRTDTSWYTGASPYVIRDRVTILKGSTLTIEAGTVVKSDGKGIYVRGRLIASGDANNRIIFSSAATKPTSEDWEGITFEDTSDNSSIIKHAKIQHAATAITLISSSPTINHTILNDNGTGIISREFSKPRIQANIIKNSLGDGIVCQNSDPVITLNQITRNRGNGIMVESSKPAITKNNINDNDKYALLVATGGTEIITATDNWWGYKTREEIAGEVSGAVYYSRVLDAPYPEGKPIILEPIRIASKVAKPIQKETKEPPPGPSEAKEILPSSPAGEIMEQAERLTMPGKPGKVPNQPRGTQEAAQGHESYFRAGLNHYQQGDLDKAAQAMEMASKLAPANIAYHYNLGLVYSELGQDKEAVREWQAVLKLDPGHPNARMLVNMKKE